MATPQRLFQEDSYYHVYNRGNRKQPIFLVDQDYQRFLNKIKDYGAKVGVEVIAYCLMSNHFHFLLKQNQPDQIREFMLRLSTSHSKYFNIKYEQVGSVIQGRFKAKLVDKEDYLIYLTAYIHLNPAGRSIEEVISYPWSSLYDYVNERTNCICIPTPVLSLFARDDPKNDYRTFIAGQFAYKNFDYILHLLIDEE